MIRHDLGPVPVVELTYLAIEADAGRASAQLGRCLRTLDEQGGDINRSGRRLLRHCAFAAFNDLRDHGLEDVARGIVATRGLP